jgi:hypothetical protein
LFRSHRVLSVAACVLVALVVAGTVTAALGRSTTAPPRVAIGTTATATAGGAGVTHGPPTTTTLPGFSSTKSASGQSAPAALVPTGGAASAGTAGSTNDQLNATSGSPAVTIPTSPTSPSVPNGVGQSSKIEQTGSLSLTVAKGGLAKAMNALTLLAGTYDGFVANSQSAAGSGTGGPPSGTITLQVPVASFGQVLKAAQSLGKTTSLTTKATDVTGQYVDLQSQITALQASRQQYLTIMTRATSVGDVLAVQSQLDSIQDQIQQLQGQLNVLNSETAYSTLTASLSEPGAPAHHTSHHSRTGLSQAWHDSVGGFVAGVEGLIRIAGPLLFALLCLGALVLGGRVLWRRYQRHNL